VKLNEKDTEKIHKKSRRKKLLNEKVDYDERVIYSTIDKLDDIENIIAELIKQREKNFDFISEKTVEILHTANCLEADLCNLLTAIIERKKS